MRKFTAVALAAGLIAGGAAGIYPLAASAHESGSDGDGPRYHKRFQGHGELGAHQRGGVGRHSKDGRRGRGRGKVGNDFGMGMFDRFDGDDNGEVTLEEALKAAPQPQHHAERLDGDKNGTVTSVEIDAWLAEMRENLLKRLDANEDGKIDKTDQAAQVERRFARLDANKDGKVTREEAQDVIGDWRRQARESMRDMRRRFWNDTSE